MSIVLTYDHYIAVDWSINNMAIARMSAINNKITVVDVPSDISEFKAYLKSLKGKKILTIEESTPAQWLYIELIDHVDRLIICDPFRNRLLSEGSKTDKIDATKLVQLLKANLLKEVFHSNDRFLDLRRIVSGYEDLVKSGVRLKNQRYSLLRSCGLSGKEKNASQLKNPSAQRVLECLERQIECYEKEKNVYKVEFEKLRKKYPQIQHQDSLPGIGLIGAVKIVSRVVTPYRFANAGHFLSYAGLIKLQKKSGGVNYGKKVPRYCRELKSVYKTAALATIGGNNTFKNYYEYLLKEKGYPEYQARHKLSRRLAVLSWGILKSGKSYQGKNYVNNKSQES